MRRMPCTEKPLLWFLLFLLVPIAATYAGQPTLSDSLKKELSNKLYTYKLNDFEKPSGDKIDFLKQIGNLFQQLNKFDSAIYFYQQGLDQAKITDNTELISSISYNIGIAYFKKGQYNQALEYAYMALEKDREINNPKSITATLNSIALIYQEWGAYEKALSYQLESIAINEKLNNPLEIAIGTYNLGSLYLKIGKPEMAYRYFKEAQLQYSGLIEESPQNMQYKKGYSECLYSLGSIYLTKNDLQNALKQFNSSLKIKMTINDLIGLGNCYYNIGLVLTQEKDYKTAMQRFVLSLQYKIQVNDKKGIALVYYRLGDLHAKLGNLKPAEDYAFKSIPIAKQIGDKEILKAAYQTLYSVYSVHKDYKKALGYHELFKAYTDSVLNESTSRMVEELSVKHETEKKEKENEILSNENQIKALTIQKQKSVGRYLIGVLALILSLFGVLIVLFRSKQKTNKIISNKNQQLSNQNTKISKQNKEIETKNRDLTDSILYAKRIQESMLADMDQLNKELSDSFILFKPKDIVSGDFYWFGKQGNKLIVSAIDCTGHGVPGAFMSMLGNSFLNQIVFKLGVTSPDIILRELSQEVTEALKQEETNNKDGMDMALCTIDLDTGNVEFAGAKNPLIYISGESLEKIKGDRKPIGLNQYEEKEFQKHEIDIEETTCFYMFSDGYADQFGGPNNKKFMSKRFHKLLQKIHVKPMHKQREILDKSINDWMQNHEQVDDILIVGFKIEK